MFSIILAAGWPIWPLLLASIIAVALIIERMVALRQVTVLPVGLLQRVVAEYRKNGVSDVMLANLEAQSPLGRVLAAGLRNVGSSREVMRDAIEETGGVVAHELERYLTTLGTIASISPLMGLFGTDGIKSDATCSRYIGGALQHGFWFGYRHTGNDFLAPLSRSGQWLRNRNAAASLAFGRGSAQRAKALRSKE